MGNQQHNAVRSQLFEIGKNLCLGVSVQCREGIIQHQNRALMTESPGKTQSLPLTAGQPDAAAAHQSFDAILHGGNLSIQADVPEIFPGVRLIVAHENVIPHGVVKQLRIMAQITHNAGAPGWVHTT